jgi:hypothetical protein
MSNGQKIPLQNIEPRTEHFAVTVRPSRPLHRARTVGPLEKSQAKFTSEI